MRRSRLILIAAGALLTILLSAGLVAARTSESGTSNRRTDGCAPYLPGQCPSERLDTITAPSTSIAPSTTIDLSFLNTTTTTTAIRSVSPTERVDVPADRWDILADCETGGDWSTNTGNGFGGGLQFAHGPGWSTWRAYGGEEFAPHPWDATREQQIVIAERVLAGSGWRAWPGCARKIGLL